MSQGTPRKFSEKIAIMERKQTEDAEAFKSVMQEVRPLTTPISQHPSTSQGGLAIPPWGRPGGSLPNVHEMVHQPGHHAGVMQGMAPGQNDPSMMGWGPLGVSPWMDPGMMDPNHDGRVMHSTRGRSPGAHPHQHFHPYRAAGSPTQMSPGVAYPHRHTSQERIPMDYHLHYPGVMPGQAANLLQPPDAQWRKVRSDPAIHMNAYRQPSISSQGSAGSSPHSPNDYTPPQNVSPPATSAQFQGDLSQGSSFYMDPSKSAQNHVDMKPNSCDPGVHGYNSPIASPGQDPISSSPGGSLPNLPSPLRSLQTNFGYPPPYVEAVNHQVHHTGGHVTVHQRHSIQLPPGGTGYPSGQVSGYNLAATPPYAAESQSAPTSPADVSNVASPGSTYEIQNQMQNIQLQNESNMMSQQQQQWYQQNQQQQQQFYQQHQPLQRYNSSTSPDVMSAPSPNGSGGQIPNIVFTGADGSISGHHQNQMGDNLADCFGDLQASHSLSFAGYEMFNCERSGFATRSAIATAAEPGRQSGGSSVGAGVASGSRLIAPGPTLQNSYYHISRLQSRQARRSVALMACASGIPRATSHPHLSSLLPQFSSLSRDDNCFV
uniref:Transducer of regulated CREB activity N-terminal domain-containing protein n=1 Tax=Plectus sambesii TaxID=2011161 RepID=A0A914UIA9_9BILA